MKKIILILILMAGSLELFSQDIVETVTTGYYIVYQNGIKHSQHTREDKATAKAVSLMLENPTDSIRISKPELMVKVNMDSYLDAQNEIKIFERDTIRKAVVLATPSDTYNKPGNMLVLLYGDGQSFTSMTDSASIEYADEHQPVYFRLKETVHQFGDSTYIVESKRMFPDYVRMAGSFETVIDSNRIRLREFYTKQCQITKLEYKLFGAPDWINYPTPLGFSASKKAWNKFAHGRWIEGLKPDTRYVFREWIETQDGETLISPARVLKTSPLK
jgi:hypothetical protein